MGPSAIAILLLVAGEPAVGLLGNVGVGGGYESNLTLVTAGSPSPGSGLATAWAGFGGWWDPAESTHLSAGLRYDGALYPGATDLTRNGGGLDLLLIQELGGTVAAILGASGVWTWYGDPARTGPGLSVRATIRVRPLPWLYLRAGYAYAHRWAEEPAYTTGTSSLLGSVEARVASGIYVGVAYAWQWGDQTFYATAAPAALATAPSTLSGPGTGGGWGGAGGYRGGSGVFADLVPYTAATRDGTLTPTFEAAVWEGLYLFASYSYTWGSSEEGDYTTQLALAGAGYRF